MVYSGQELCHALWDCELQYSLYEVILYATKVVVHTVPAQLARLTLKLVQTTLVLFLQGGRSRHDSVMSVSSFLILNRMALVQKHPILSSNIFSHVDLFSGYNSVQ